MKKNIDIVEKSRLFYPLSVFADKNGDIILTNSMSEDEMSCDNSLVCRITNQMIDSLCEKLQELKREGENNAMV